MIQSEKLLDTQYTLTVSTNPASATCTLTYNGVSYTTKSLTVPAGSIISYSIYYSTYGTTTGSIIMDSDKTLTCTGTYSTSTQYVQYSIPTLSANGTVGGSSFAISPSKEPISNRQGWRAFDGQTSQGREWQLNQYNDLPGWMIWYFPQEVSITSVKVYNGNSGFKNGTIDYSYNGSSWTTKKSWTNSTTSNYSTWTISSISTSSASKYKYWRIYFPSGSWNGTAYRPQIAEFEITAYYNQSSNNYYWDKTIS